MDIVTKLIANHRGIKINDRKLKIIPEPINNETEIPDKKRRQEPAMKHQQYWRIENKESTED